MSDVEKYGLWAVIGFTGILVLIGLGGGEDGEPLQRESLRPVLVQAPAGEASVAPRATQASAPVRGRRAAGNTSIDPAAQVFTVQPVVGSGDAFRWDEGPISYPGPRSAVGAAPSTEVVTHTVRKGETLGDISSRYFGTTTRWRELLVLNPGLDEKKLQVGQTLVVKGATPPSTPTPTAAPPSSTSTDGRRTYVVRAGDTLGEIARKVLGSSKRSTDLYEANRHVLSSPDRLRAGQVLVLP